MVVVDARTAKLWTLVGMIEGAYRTVIIIHLCDTELTEV
jgi:hypothetical protein